MSACKPTRESTRKNSGFSLGRELFFLKARLKVRPNTISLSLADSMGFSSIVDQIEINELGIEPDGLSGDIPGLDRGDGGLFYDRDIHEETFETKGHSLLRYSKDDLLV
ncbi:hypothetical protein SBDP2_210003 [Syntrophobacter sp. SbD2]|nr:hypothetical protein SBDP2_210003 [Syntrophobacter sp. SbD2]